MNPWIRHWPVSPSDVFFVVFAKTSYLAIARHSVGVVDGDGEELADALLGGRQQSVVSLLVFA